MNDIELFAENELTPIETEERAFHERIIHEAERGKQKLTEIQLASLKVLFDNKLYRNTHKTFPEYCKATFDFEQAYSYYQLGFSRIRENLSTMVEFLPENERQARPLAKLPTPALQAQAWTQAQVDSGKEQPSNREVAEVVAKVQAELDAATQRCEEFRQESNERRKTIRDLETQIDLLKAQPAPDPEKIIVVPDDYETTKAEAARLQAKLARLKKEQDRLVNDRLKTKLNERAREAALFNGLGTKKDRQQAPFPAYISFANQIDAMAKNCSLFSEARKAADRNPCFSAFAHEMALPAAVRGPVLCRHG